jgi:hypothetical protein
MRWLPVLVLIGCGPKDGADGDVVAACDLAGETEVMVLRQISFPREVDGVSPGFDLDGAVTSSGDGTGCGVDDFVSPQGIQGIDNAFARLRPALDTTEAAALDSIVLEAINSGGLLAIVQLDGVGEDPMNDDCVDVSITAALGVPMVGNDGLLLAGQTFSVDPDAEVSKVMGARIVDGVLEDGPVDLRLPFKFLDADVVFWLQDGRLRLERDDEGHIQGQVGGGVHTDELSTLAHETGIDETVEVLLDSILGLNADLAPDAEGVCEQLSVTLEVEAVQAFFFEP